MFFLVGNRHPVHHPISSVQLTTSHTAYAISILTEWMGKMAMLTSPVFLSLMTAIIIPTEKHGSIFSEIFNSSLSAK